mmetsp:Transcript_71349/g.113076  ORF Transcript_71349/g.113076 Transcript_71349/m.113076 type:complete len:275 (-) Transcript_71349:38-862(-)
MKQMLTLSCLLFVNIAGAARRKLISLRQHTDEQGPVWGTKNPEATFKGYCSQVAQDQWKTHGFVVAEDKKNGQAYVYCKAKSNQIRYKVSCRKELCTKSGKVKDDQVEGQKGWCFVRNGCGKWSTKGQCKPLDYAPVRCLEQSGRDEVDDGAGSNEDKTPGIDPVIVPPTQKELAQNKANSLGTEFYVIQMEVVDHRARIVPGATVTTLEGDDVIRATVSTDDRGMAYVVVKDGAFLKIEAEQCDEKELQWDIREFCPGGKADCRTRQTLNGKF